MFLFEEEDNGGDNCFYTPKFGLIKPTSIQFDDHSLLGSNFYQYKPEKIIFWTSEKNKITGIQTWFKNINDQNSINSGENKGSLSQNFHEFIINSNEYLIDCEIWKDSKYINGISLKTNRSNPFFVGEKIGTKVDIPHLADGKKIIVSFFGSYDECLESFGLHLMLNKDYMKVLFTGYFELKAKLKKEKYKDEIMEKVKNGKFSIQEEYIIKTCLLPSAPFNEVMKFCVI